MTDTKTPMPREVLPPGKRIGRYELADRLAMGGMAEIFLACERGNFGLERMVVVKRILPHLAMHDRFVEMFLQEAKFVARMNHPNVVQIFELGQSDPKHGEAGAFYIAMEYVSGVSLRELMRAAALQEIEIPTDVCLSLMIQACAGAHAAHELKDAQGNPIGLVHRDISPHNLMVSYEGHVKLLDFGIAKATEVALEHTRTGAIKGKVHYMSPEQCRQEKLDRRTDVFSMGIILWELLTARRLFKRQHDLESMQAIVEGDRWSVAEFRKGLTPTIIEAVDKALMTDRDARFKSADAMRRFIKGAAEDAGLKLDHDAVRLFLNKVCKERMSFDKRAVKEALERTIVHIQNHPPSESGKTRAARPSAKTDTASHSMAERTPPISQVPSAEQTLVSQNPGRRRFMAGAALLTLGGAGAFAFTQWPSKKNEKRGEVALTKAPVVSGAPIKIGFAPVVDTNLLLKELEPIRLYLERNTKRPIVFWVAASYSELAEALVGGRTPFASLPPNLYIETKKRAPQIEAMVYKVQDGSTGSDSVILVGEHTGIQSVADLKGHTFCYADEKSTSSYKLPRAFLKKQGIDPDKDLTLKASGNHLQTLRDVLSGACDVGATYSGAYLRAGENGVAVSRLRSIAIAGRSPHDVICSGANIDEKERALIRDALLTFDVMAETQKNTIGSMERVSGFSRADDTDYNPLREAIAQSEPIEAPKKKPRRSKRRRSRKRSSRKGSKKSSSKR